MVIADIERSDIEFICKNIGSCAAAAADRVRRLMTWRRLRADRVGRRPVGRQARLRGARRGRVDARRQDHSHHRVRCVSLSSLVADPPPARAPRCRATRQPVRRRRRCRTLTCADTVLRSGGGDRWRRGALVKGCLRACARVSCCRRRRPPLTAAGAARTRSCWPRPTGRCTTRSALCARWSSASVSRRAAARARWKSPSSSPPGRGPCPVRSSSPPSLRLDVARVRQVSTPIACARSPTRSTWCRTRWPRTPVSIRSNSSPVRAASLVAPRA